MMTSRRNDYTPLNPVQVEQKLREVVRRLEAETEEYEAAAMAAAQAEADWKLHEARTVVQRDGGSVAEAERTARVTAADTYRQYKITDALERAAKERLRATEGVLSALQTVSGSLKVQYGAINSAGHGA